MIGNNSYMKRAGHGRRAPVVAIRVELKLRATALDGNNGTEIALSMDAVRPHCCQTARHSQAVPCRLRATIRPSLDRRP